MTRNEMETAIVARLLSDNSVLTKVWDIVRPGDFEDGALSRIFNWAGWRIAEGKYASLLTLKAAQASCPALGGPADLERIACAMVIPGDPVKWALDLRP